MGCATPGPPQPTNIWVTASNELRIAFDKPVEPSITNDAIRARIELGEYVAAADGLEVLKPPYKVVKLQTAAPRGSLRVISAALSADGHEMLLKTDPHSQPLNYALYLPGLDI